jgi:5-methyltetrahydrofolate--homocysteine methyltransferase
VLDINSGAVFSNKMAEDPRYADNNFVEPPLMKELVERVQAIVDVPLCIDSSVPGALENGLQAAKGRPLLNSVTGEEERLETILPLVKKYDVPVVAISNDDTGISEDPDVRFAVAKKIVERAADHGIKPHDIVVDPLVMPSAPWAPPACRCLRWCAGCARNLASTPRVGHPTSRSACPTGTASTMRSCRWQPLRA